MSTFSVPELHAKDEPVSKNSSKKLVFLVTVLLSLALVSLGVFALQRGRAKKEQRGQLSKLMSEDTAGIQTLMAGLQGKDITYGEAEDLCEKDQDDRTKLGIAARSLDVPGVQASKDAFISLLDREGDLVRGMKYLTAKQVQSLTAMEEKYVPYSGNYYSFDYEKRENNEVTEHRRKAFRDLSDAQDSIKSALAAVQSAEKQLGQAATKDGLVYRPNSQDYSKQVLKEANQ